ncbi:MAG: hypothetical protein V1773_02705 [bacterium]
MISGNINKLYFVLLALPFLLMFCKDEINDTDIDDRSIPAKNVSYAKDIQPIFDYKCNFSGCHADGVNTSYMLTSWTNTRDYPNVIPGDAENSIIILRITGKVPPIMPPLGSYTTAVTSTQEKGIKTWINEGAQNN